MTAPWKSLLVYFGTFGGQPKGMPIIVSLGTCSDRPMRVFLVYSAAFHDGYKEKLLFLPFGFTSRDYRGSVYTKRRSVL